MDAHINQQLEKRTKIWSCEHEKLILISPNQNPQSCLTSTEKKICTYVLPHILNIKVTANNFKWPIMMSGFDKALLQRQQRKEKLIWWPLNNKMRIKI